MTIRELVTLLRAFPNQDLEVVFMGETDYAHRVTGAMLEVVPYTWDGHNFDGPSKTYLNILINPDSTIASYHKGQM